MNEFLLYGLGGFLILIVLIILFRLVLVDKFPYVPKKIMSAAELRFYRILDPLVPANLRLGTKPRLGDLIDVDPALQQKDSSWKARFGAPIWSKHIDFVLFDPINAEIALCIELDDSSHQTAEAKSRDAFKDKALAAADLPLLRIPVQRHYDTAALRQSLSEYLD